jgi:hypothetical protein
MNGNDDLLFDGEEVDDAKTDRAKWKVLIADDEKEVHAVTQIGNNDALDIRSSGFAAIRRGSDFYIHSGIGQFENCIDRPVWQVVPEETFQLFMHTLGKHNCSFGGNVYMGYFCTKDGAENVLHIQVRDTLSELDRELLRVFSSNVAVAFDSIYFYHAKTGNQREVVFTLMEDL